VKLVLFDIDGTILWSDGAGRRAMEGALTDVFGSPGSPRYRYDGKTDQQIVRELMRAEGHADAHIDSNMTALLDNYLAGLERELASGECAPQCFGGVVDLLDALDACADRIVGLLTGNLEAGAAKKLRAVGIDPGRFRISAYGSDHEVRRELPAVALRRAREALGVELPGSQMIIIGDTPADIDCGRAVGARAIGVATGRYSVEDLAAHDPYAVFADLTDTAAVMRAIDEA
jgi:phosphoglycolate phosphatase-like HAD superfamily hydrolase